MFWIVCEHDVYDLGHQVWEETFGMEVSMVSYRYIRVHWGWYLNPSRIVSRQKGVGIEQACVEADPVPFACWINFWRWSAMPACACAKTQVSSSWPKLKRHSKPIMAAPFASVPPMLATQAALGSTIAWPSLTALLRKRVQVLCVRCGRANDLPDS